MYKYLKWCPRGFANEVTYYRVPQDKVSEAEAECDDHADRLIDDGGYAEWTSDKVASKPGVAIDWANRHW